MGQIFVPDRRIIVPDRRIIAARHIPRMGALQQALASQQISGGGGGSVTFSECQGTKWFGGSGTTQSVNITLGAGNCLFIGIGWQTESSTISSISNVTETLIRATSDADGASSTYYVPNTSAGAVTITVTWSADPGYGVLCVLEMVGANTTTPLDKEAATSALPTAGVVSSGSVTPATNGQLLVGFTFDGDGGATLTAGTDFTIPTNGNQSTIGAIEYFEQATAAAHAATFNETGSNFGVYKTSIATFKS